MNEKKTISINSLAEQLNDIYKNDTTLDYLKRFEEDRKTLLNLDLATSSWQDPTIQEKILDMENAIGSTTIQDAFKSHTDYEQYANPILSSIHNNNYDSLQEEIRKTTAEFISNDYMQTIKATDLFNDTIERAKAVGLTEHLDSYNSKLSESILQYENDNKLKAAQSILGLTSAIDTDIFQKEIESINATKLITDRAIEETDKYKIEEPNYQDKILDTPLFELPKYEDTIMGKADKQVEVLERLSNYMIQQNKNLEIQNEIANEQNNNLKEQNLIIKVQVEETSKTSKIAFWTAIISILTSSIITIFVFLEEDKSDIQNHNEFIELLKENNNNNILNELVVQLKEQNKNSMITNEEFIRQNQYLKRLLKEKK